MKRLAPLLAALLTLTASAQDAAPGKPLLWRIAGAKPSYIFGTIHLSGPRETQLAPAVKSAIDGADAVYCEVPLDTDSQMKAALAMMGKGKSLRDALPKDLFDRAEAQLKHINPSLSLAPLQSMEVWALNVLLPLLEEQIKNPGGKPLDVQLYALAQSAKKEVGGIETLDEQFQVLASFNEADQLALLRGTLDEMEKARRENRSLLGELRDAYLSGDVAKIDTKMKESIDAVEPALAKRFLDALLTKRNHHMAERIAAKIKAEGGKSFFFAIGAGHLSGEEGVVRLLEKAAMRVERVE
jgi:uncharacterized protein